MVVSAGNALPRASDQNTIHYRYGKMYSKNRHIAIARLLDILTIDVGLAL
jgi:hypothetical protein